jgi:hypothetical protein
MVFMVGYFILFQKKIENRGYILELSFWFS